MEGYLTHRNGFLKYDCFYVAAASLLLFCVNIEGPDPLLTNMKRV